MSASSSHRPRVTGRPRLSTTREAALRAAWTSGDEDVRLTVLEVAVLLGWGPSTVSLHLREGRMPGSRVGHRSDSRAPWTVRAGDLRQHYGAALDARRAGASDADSWI